MTTQNITTISSPFSAASGPSAMSGDASAPSKGPTSGSLYVGDLAPDVTEALLFEIFNPVGPVSSIRVCRDSTTRQSLGYAYVNFHSIDDAERALDTLNFIAIKGTPCRIMWSHRDPSIRKNSSANIFIKNLDKSIDNKELYDTFSQFGNILSCKVATDITGSSKGYAFVHYADETAATKAMDEVNGKLIKDKKVVACKHERRSERQGAGTGGSKFTNLYVKNVPEDWTDDKFKSVFEQYGVTVSCYLQRDMEGKCKGFGFVNYQNHEDALRGIEEGSKLSAGEDKPNLYVGRFQKKAERVATLAKKYEDARREKSEKYKNLNLYVKNLDDDVSEAKLRELFEPFGELSSAVVMLDEKGVSRGFGFVCYANPEDASKALTEMNGRVLGTKPIYVNRAQRKEERRAQLENQFQQSINTQRMQMPMFYGPPQAGMGMPGPMMFPPQMINRRVGPFAAPHMRPGFPPQMYANPAQQQRPRNAGTGPRPYPGQRVAGPQQPKYRGGSRYPPQPMQMPSVTPPIAAHSGSLMSGELTSALAAATPEAQKQMLGEQLFPKVHLEQPDLAGKITGMLLEMDVSEILSILDNQQELKSKVQEALEVLNSHGGDQ